MGDRVKGNKAKSKVIKIMNVKLKGKDVLKGYGKKILGYEASKEKDVR